MITLTARPVDTKALDLERCREEFGVLVKTWDWMNIAERHAFMEARHAAPVLAADDFEPMRFKCAECPRYVEIEDLEQDLCPECLRREIEWAAL